MRNRIVAFYLILAVVTSTIVAVISYTYHAKMYNDEIITGFNIESILIEQMMINLQAHDVNDEMLSTISESIASGETFRRISIINTEGTVIADSLADSISVENHSDRKEFIDALANGVGTDVRRSKSTGKDLMYYAYYSKNLNLVIRLSGSVEHYKSVRNTMLFYSALAVTIAIVVSAIIAKGLSKHIVQPIAQLVNKYGDILSFNNVSIAEKYDINQLSATIELITQDIDTTIAQLQERNARVNTIINSMDNGLVAVNRSMEIIMINPMARKLFDIPDKIDGVGSPLVHVIRNRQINDILMQSTTKNMLVKDDIYIYQGGKRIISVQASPIHKPNESHINSGALVHISDITQVRKLEEMRSEFVSNVTHELKTPLTSIQGFVETLRNGAISDPKVAERFLDIIDIEADRLKSLINDILELSEIENIKQEVDREKFSLLNLANEVIDMLEVGAKEKDITFEIQIASHLKVIANPYRFKQLFINLVDNAIKYNKPGGKIIVNANTMNNFLEIRVKDTGIGIPEDKTSRIFERFYRVDKGRSRNVGGTGLGLSIVKHIAQLYSGRVRVESQEGFGSEFIVTFPSSIISRNGETK